MPTDIPFITYGVFYHIYSRGNNSENIFIQERNYAYFMELWWKHISPIAETWAFSLLRNHFHAAVYIKDKADLTGLSGNLTTHNIRVDKGLTPSGSRGDLSGLNKIKAPSQYFSNFFNAYSQGAMRSIVSPPKGQVRCLNVPSRESLWTVNPTSCA